MSRRDNGLPATSYTRVLDVETQLVDGLLERLREEDVAAYVAPAAGRRGPYGDTVLPGAPSDSLYVDAERSEQARSIVARYLVEVREDLAWASIVADFDSPADDVRPWPASEDVDDTAPAPPPLLPPSPFVVDNDARSEREEHFEPPPPPPVPVPDTINRFAWAAVIGGPLFLIVATIFDLDVTPWIPFLALMAFVAGFVTLVARMKDRPPAGFDDDDGAVV